MEKAARSKPATALVLLLLAACVLPGKSEYNSLGQAAEALVRLGKEKHGITTVPKWTDKVFWVYVPIDQKFFIESEPPVERIVRYETRSVEGKYREGIFQISYDIQPVPETTVLQKIRFDTAVGEKINAISRLTQNILFNLRKNPDNPQFFGIIAADITTGLEVIYINHLDDAKKAVHKLIPRIEYSHRTIEALRAVPQAVGDTEGRHLVFYDFEFNLFLAEQIKHRLIQKFRYAETPAQIDIDREAVKTVSHVLGIYRYDDFKSVDLANLSSNTFSSFDKNSVLMENSIERFIHRSFRRGPG